MQLCQPASQLARSQCICIYVYVDVCDNQKYAKAPANFFARHNWINEIVVLIKYWNNYKSICERCERIWDAKKGAEYHEIGIHYR